MAELFRQLQLKFAKKVQPIPQADYFAPICQIRVTQWQTLISLVISKLNAFTSSLEMYYHMKCEISREWHSKQINHSTYDGVQDLWDQIVSRLGHLSAPHAWTELFEVDLNEYIQIIEKIVHDFTELYQKIHAYARYKLREKHPDLIKERGLIPSILVKNLWGQKWEHLMDLVQP